jgi:outer membrane receptor for ferrienterochelin and colicin
LVKPKDTTALSEIKITASPIVTRLQESTASIAIIEKSDIQKK